MSEGNATLKEGYRICGNKYLCKMSLEAKMHLQLMASVSDMMVLICKRSGSC